MIYSEWIETVKLDVLFLHKFVRQFGELMCLYYNVRSNYFIFVLYFSSLVKLIYPIFSFLSIVGWFSVAYNLCLHSGDSAHIHS